MADKTARPHQLVVIQRQRVPRDRGTILADRTMPIKSKYQKCEYELCKVQITLINLSFAKVAGGKSLFSATSRHILRLFPIEL